MPRKPKDGTFARHEKVVAAVDLPGVPRGTPGKVMLKTGFTWDRYRVYFSNGVEVPWIERDQIVRPGDLGATADAG